MSKPNKPNRPAAAAAAAPPDATEAAKRRIPKVDPGLATVTASALALIGTIVTVSIRASDGGGSTDPATAGTATTVVVESSAPDGTGAIDPTDSTALTPGEPAAPVIQLPGSLAEDERALVEGASDQLLLIAERLPLIVDDGFTTDDYAWPEGDATAAGGVTCTWQRLDGRYDTTIHTGDGPSWCSNGLAKTAADFALTLDLALTGASNSEVGVLFRVSSDGATYYELRFNPQTQMFWFSFVNPGGTTAIVAPTFAGEIAKDGPNRVTVLALQDTLALFLNDTLVASITGAEYTLDAGRVLVLLQLNEANVDETLSLTHYELRGN